MLNKTAYTVTKFLAQIALPAAGTLYFALAGIWGLPDAEKVIGSITSVDIFLGLLLGLSTTVYNSSTAKYDGDIDVVTTSTPTGAKTTFKLNLNSDPNDLIDKSEILFKINPLTPPQVAGRTLYTSYDETPTT